MMKTTIGDEENLPARQLAIKHAAHVEACFADEVAAQFDAQFGMRETGLGFVGNERQIGTDRGEVDPLVAREVRNSQAAAEVQRADGVAGMLGELAGQVEAFALGFNDGFGLQVL